MPRGPAVNEFLLKREFEAFDSDGSGEVDVSELGPLLASLGVKRSRDQVQEIIQTVDKDASGSLSYDEFKLLFEEARLRSVFEELDADSSGRLDASELSLALRKLGYRMSPAQCKALLGKVDTDNDGQVTFTEFREFFQYVPLASLASIAEHLVGDIPLDVGSDLAPPVPSKSIPVHECLLVGGLAGITSRTATAPLERIKLQAQTVGVSSVRGELHRLVQAEGFRSLWAGNGANCLRVFPFAGIVMLTYTRLVKALPCDDELDPWEPFWRSIAGGTAGAIGTVLTYPIDVIRTRLTVDGSAYNHSILSCLRHSVKTEGIVGLYRGMTPTLCAVVPFLAIQQATHDVCKRALLDSGFEPSVPIFLASSMMAGAMAQTIVYPLDLIRRRVQLTASPSGASLSQASASVVTDYTWLAGLRAVIRDQGLRGAFVGISPTYMKVIPSVMIAKTMADWLVSLKPSEKLNGIVSSTSQRGGK